jgi:RNA polymerase sigma-70 factor (ECF subfamily)
MQTDLVEKAQDGDEQAFASLAVSVGNRLQAVAHRILRDAALAEDATQQALLAIWRDLPQLRDPQRFDAWSYRLLVRACYVEGRRSGSWGPNLHLLPTDEPAARSLAFHSGSSTALLMTLSPSTSSRRKSRSYALVPTPDPTICT